jgi:hypothetical protein
MYLEENIYIIDFYHSKFFEGPNFLFRPGSMKPQDRPCLSIKLTTDLNTLRFGSAGVQALGRRKDGNLASNMGSDGLVLWSGNGHR